MKKLFKKSIACLIAVLMVVSTMPFTAITAQAADASALLSAMQAFEKKMDGSVYTNMDTAYSAYVAASTAYDAAYYGGDDSVDVTTPATNLNNAVSKMTKTNLTVYTGTAKARFSGDTSDISQSQNLLYSQQGVTYGLDNCTALFANDMILHNTGVSWSKISSCVYHADSVVLYDGTSASIPVICYVDNFIDGSSGKAKVDKYSVYLTNSSYYGLQNSAWKGGSNSGQNFQTIYNGSDTNISSDSSSTTYQGYESGSITTFSDQHQYEYYANVLTTNSNLANIFTTTNPYSATLPAVTWNMHVVGQAKTPWGSYGRTDHTLTANSSAKIYAINYLPLKDAITADANKSARQNVASYKEGGMSTYLAGCLSAASLNPNNYSYSTDLAGQVDKCASDISTAVTKFKTAPTADNTENYPKLRSAFDYSGALTGFNNATYSVREAYNGGVNNGFTQASYDNFKAKYEAAQNVMKAVATSGYTNGSGAATAASELKTAFNALQHEHSFTGAYVNNNDGTHSQKCAFYDKCATLSDSVAHSYNSSVTTQPTCTTAGITTYTCACGDSYTKDEPAANGHTQGEAVRENENPATCTTDGSYDEVVYCTVCKEELSRVQKSIDKLGHSFTNYVKDNNATCEKDGTETAKCDRCDVTNTRTISGSATGHNYTSVVTKAATCTEQGVRTYTCQNDNSHTYIEYISIDKNNHTGLTSIPAVEATCTSTGLTEGQKCTACGVTTIPQQETDIDPDNHTDIVIDMPLNATCTETGLTEGSHCEACGTVFVAQQTTDALGHAVTVVVTPQKDATCTETGTTAVMGCSRCDYKEGGEEIPATGHNWGKWTSISDTQHQRVCANEKSHVETKDHNIVNGACTECDYKAFDMVAYNKAVAEYDAIKAGDYTTKYTAKSREAYETAVEAAMKNSFATQEDVDAAAAAILSAKTKLVYAQPEIKFVEVDANGIENVIETKNYTYGTPVEFTKDADNIAKWIVKTQNGKVETKVATSQTTYTMIATEPATVYVHLTKEKTESVQYSKVSFISKNGAVSSVQYLEVGKTLNTIDVPGVEIPFYKFVKWNKASVVANGSDIEVKAVYEFIGTVENKCRVHYDGFDGGEKEYTYDSFVYLFGAEDKTLALSTDGTKPNIITYLNENAFYAPHTADIYVIEVDSQQASIGITGSYVSSTDTKKTAAFNCKFFLPAGCTVVEYGLTATSSTGKSMKIKGETASARGEYCVKASMNNTSPVTSVEGVAYLTYKDAKNNLHTIYSTSVTQNL